MEGEKMELAVYVEVGFVGEGCVEDEGMGCVFE